MTSVVKKTAMQKKTHEHRSILNLNGLQVPVRIITERGRRATIASVRERALYIRLPHGLQTHEREQRIQEMIAWARKTAGEKPEAFKHFAAPPLSGAYGFNFRGKEYDIDVEACAGGRHMIEGTGAFRMRVGLCTGVHRPNLTKVIPKLLAKYFALKCLPLVSQRVHELNARHFQRPINHVKLSDTYTRWGSCSHLGNINLATRLLLAPDEVMDAVIIHELAHLVEANHSDRFWAQVARALPEHRAHDKWLKEHGNTLRFVPLPKT